MPPPCTPPHWKPDKPAIWMHWKLGSSLEASIPGRDSFGTHLDAIWNFGWRSSDRTPSFDSGASPGFKINSERELSKSKIIALRPIWMHWKPKSFDSGASPGFKINSERELSKSKIIALRPIWMHWKPKIILYTGTGLIWMHTGFKIIQNQAYLF